MSLGTTYRRLDHGDSESRPRAETVALLRRLGHEATWRRNPPAVLSALQSQTLAEHCPERLFALAELCYLHGNRLRSAPTTFGLSQRFHLAAAVFAWDFLFGNERRLAFEDVRGSAARTLYNRAIALAFTEDARPEASLAWPAEPLKWPIGDTNLTVLVGRVPRALADTRRFLPSEALVTKGLVEESHLPGFGAPLVAELPGEPTGIARAAPATLIARVEGSAADFAAGRGAITIDLYSPIEDDVVEIAGRGEPLAGDFSTPIAYALGRTEIWHRGRSQFLDARQRVPTGIVLQGTHRTGRIPVVFVHGTLGSPVAWAQMLNVLQADPLVREHFEFWLFLYNTGNPIPYSADLLRQALQSKITEFDPNGIDPSLRQLVLIGHSQGGLLAKLLGVSSGEVLWRTVSASPFDAQSFTAPQRELITRSFFIEPLPAVRRIVFIATPHRGSPLALGWRGSLAHLLLRIPEQVTHVTAALRQTADTPDLAARAPRRSPNSFDGMAPANPWLLALAKLPLAPGIAAHSIIGIEDDTPPPAGTDGVVSYASAHLDLAASELVVRCNHKEPRHPAVIEEVRRILHEHLSALAAAAPDDASTAFRRGSPEGSAK